MVVYCFPLVLNKHGIHVKAPFSIAKPCLCNAARMISVVKLGLLLLCCTIIFGHVRALLNYARLFQADLSALTRRRGVNLMNYVPAVACSQGLADNTVIAKVNKDVWDLDRPLEDDCSLELLKFDDDEAQAVSPKPPIVVDHDRHIGQFQTIQLKKKAHIVM